MAVLIRSIGIFAIRSFMLLGSIFWITLLVLLLIAIVSSFLKLRKRDRTLRLFKDQYISINLGPGRQVRTGKLHPNSLGSVQIDYRSPEPITDGPDRTAMLLSAGDMQQSLCVSRIVRGLDPHHLALRQRQIQRNCNPRFIRRRIRNITNFMTTIKDAIVNTFTQLLGTVGSVSPVGKVISNQKSGITEIAGNFSQPKAYEPNLERNIGRGVEVEIALPDGSPVPSVHHSGWLVSYTENYIAIFDTSEPRDPVICTIDSTLEKDGLTMERGDGWFKVSNASADPCSLGTVTSGQSSTLVNAVLLPGSSINVALPGSESVSLEIIPDGQMDLVCPRACATVRYVVDMRATGS